MPERKRTDSPEHIEHAEKATAQGCLQGNRPVRPAADIGGLFAVYGVVLTLLGIFGAHVQKTKAAGINIDLWAGLACWCSPPSCLPGAITHPLGSQVAAEELTEAPPPTTG